MTAERHGMCARFSWLCKWQPVDRHTLMNNRLFKLCPLSILTLLSFLLVSPTLCCYVTQDGLLTPYSLASAS